MVPDTNNAPEWREGFRAALDALLPYVEHDSWRCEHPPHYYLADTPADLLEGRDCYCGLIATLEELSVDPGPWRNAPDAT